MQHDHLIQGLVQRLQQVRGIKAIVLGGSYARGVQRPDSDLDIGLYYHEEQPLDIEHIRHIASEVNDIADPTVTDLGGWGTWVNGGAWLIIAGQRVDFLYRNIDFVTRTIDECNTGKIRSDYWQQPSYGFHSFMYCTETSINRPLYDPEHVIERLKARVEHYSPQLKQAIIKDFLWSARFTLDNLYKSAGRGEIYMVAGGIARFSHCLIQVLYALNETYYISEKQLERDLLKFRIQPAQFQERVYTLLGAIGSTSQQLQISMDKAEALYQDMAALVREQ